MTFGKIGARPLVKSWTARDYVQNGLVAMWDGIENAGWGTHDSNATTWKNLVHETDSMQFAADPQWGASCLKTRAGCYTITGSHTLPTSISAQSAFTCEIVFRCSASNVNVFVLGYSCYGGGGRGAFYLPLFDRFCMCGDLTGFSSLRDGNIHSAVGSFNGSTFQRIIDGTVVTSSASPYTTNTSTISTVSVGSLYAGLYSGDSEVYSIRIHNRALTAAEVAANYIVDKARFDLPQIA